MHNDMKKRFLAVMMAFAALTAGGQAPADTLITVESPRSVTVEKTDGSTVVTIKGSSSDELFNYRYSVSPDTISDAPLLNIPFTGMANLGHTRTVTSVDCFRGFYGGAVIPLSAPDAIKTSMEFGVDRIVGLSVSRRGADFSMGLGIGYRYIGIGRGCVADKQGDALVLMSAPDGAADVSSRIDSWAIRIPMLYTQSIHRSFGFSLGVVANFNFHTTAHMNYNIADVAYSKSVKGLHQRILTPDLVLTVGAINIVGAYIRWSPVKTFKSAYGPGWTSLSVGISTAF